MKKLGNFIEIGIKKESFNKIKKTNEDEKFIYLEIPTKTMLSIAKEVILLKELSEEKHLLKGVREE